MTLLGINIDHVATVRQARGEIFPDPLTAALAAATAGADGITAHLREDRRHIQDKDLFRLKESLPIPLNMEMAATTDIIRVAEKLKPSWVCIVPEKRKELTTEGGLRLWPKMESLRRTIARLHAVGVKVSLFIDADLKTVRLAGALKADAIELHTGVYAKVFRTSGPRLKKELQRLRAAAEEGVALGLMVNAGHGLDYENVGTLLEIHPFHEFNIGFSIVARSLFVGISQAVKEMKDKMRNICAAY